MEQVFFFFVIVGFDGEDAFQSGNVRIAVVFQMAHSAFKIAYLRNADFIYALDDGFHQIDNA